MSTEQDPNTNIPMEEQHASTELMTALTTKLAASATAGSAAVAQVHKCLSDKDKTIAELAGSLAAQLAHSKLLQDRINDTARKAQQRGFVISPTPQEPVRETDSALSAKFGSTWNYVGEDRGFVFGRRALREIANFADDVHKKRTPEVNRVIADKYPMSSPAAYKLQLLDVAETFQFHLLRNIYIWDPRNLVPGGLRCSEPNCGRTLTTDGAEFKKLKPIYYRDGVGIFVSYVYKCTDHPKRLPADGEELLALLPSDIRFPFVASGNALYDATFADEIRRTATTRETMGGLHESLQLSYGTRAMAIARDLLSIVESANRDVEVEFASSSKPSGKQHFTKAGLKEHRVEHAKRVASFSGAVSRFQRQQSSLSNRLANPPGRKLLNRVWHHLGKAQIHEQAMHMRSLKFYHATNFVLRCDHSYHAGQKDKKLWTLLNDIGEVLHVKFCDSEGFRSYGKAMASFVKQIGEHYPNKRINITIFTDNCCAIAKKFKDLFADCSPRSIDGKDDQLITCSIKLDVFHLLQRVGKGIPDWHTTDHGRAAQAAIKRLIFSPDGKIPDKAILSAKVAEFKLSALYTTTLGLWPRFRQQFVNFARHLTNGCVSDDLGWTYDVRRGTNMVEAWHRMLNAYCCSDGAHLGELEQALRYAQMIYEKNRDLGMTVRKQTDGRCSAITLMSELDSIFVRCCRDFRPAASVIVTEQVPNPFENVAIAPPPAEGAPLITSMAALNRDCNFYWLTDKMGLYGDSPDDISEATAELIVVEKANLIRLRGGQLLENMSAGDKPLEVTGGDAGSWTAATATAMGTFDNISRFNDALPDTLDYGSVVNVFSTVFRVSTAQRNLTNEGLGRKTHVGCSPWEAVAWHIVTTSGRYGLDVESYDDSASMLSAAELAFAAAKDELGYPQFVERVMLAAARLFSRHILLCHPTDSNDVCFRLFSPDCLPTDITPVCLSFNGSLIAELLPPAGAIGALATEADADAVRTLLEITDEPPANAGTIPRYRAHHRDEEPPAANTAVGTHVASPAEDGKYGPCVMIEGRYVTDAASLTTTLAVRSNAAVNDHTRAAFFQALITAERKHSLWKVDGKLVDRVNVQRHHCTHVAAKNPGSYYEPRRPGGKVMWLSDSKISNLLTNHLGHKITKQIRPRRGLFHVLTDWPTGGGAVTYSPRDMSDLWAEAMAALGRKVLLEPLPPLDAAAGTMVVTVVGGSAGSGDDSDDDSGDEQGSGDDEVEAGDGRGDADDEVEAGEGQGDDAPVFPSLFGDDDDEHNEDEPINKSRKHKRGSPNFGGPAAPTRPAGPSLLLPTAAAVAELSGVQPVRPPAAAPAAPPAEAPAAPAAPPADVQAVAPELRRPTDELRQTWRKQFGEDVAASQVRCAATFEAVEISEAVVDAEFATRMDASLVYRRRGGAVPVQRQYGYFKKKLGELNNRLKAEPLPTVATAFEWRFLAAEIRLLHTVRVFLDYV